jgi:hypothetical protein
MREFVVPNVTSVIITTNYKQNGLFLPPDDRRHYVASSDRDKSDFSEGYWQALHDWYDHGGKAHVAAYLTDYDLSTFNAKAPPPKTEAFWSIVDANRAPEDAELSDVLDKLGWPDAVTIEGIRKKAGDSGMYDFMDWLKDRRNSRKIGHRMLEAGYERVHNPDSKQGLWRYGGERCAIYAKSNLTPSSRLQAARGLLKSSTTSATNADKVTALADRRRS